MPRILHVLKQTSDFQAQRSSTILSQAVAADLSITTRTVGRGGDDRNALLMLLSLRGKSASGFETVHVWDSDTLTAAAFAPARQIIFSPTTLLTKSATRWLLRLMRRRRICLVCSSTWERDVYTRRGVPLDRCQVIRPGFQMPTAPANRDASLRALLGFGDRDYVLFSPGESTRAAGHPTAVWTASILHVLDPCYRILLWGRGAQAMSCRRLADKLLQPGLLTLAEEKLGRRVEFEELLGAADAVVFAPNAPVPILPLALCMAAGLPIISPAMPQTTDLLVHHRSGIVIPRLSPRLLAQSVLELRNNPNLGSTISQGGQSVAAKTFDLDAYLGQYQKLYRQLD